MTRSRGGDRVKDPNDKGATDWLLAATRPRQAAYVERQRAMGRRQRGYWLTDAEAKAVTALIEQLRGENKGAGEDD